MITHWQNILKGKTMSKRNITFIIMIITLKTLPLSACGKNNISTDNSQKLQSESGQEYDDGRDAHQDVLLIMNSSGEEIRDSDGIADNGIAAKPLCHNQPV